MNLYDYNQTNLINKLYSYNSLLDILISVENVLDVYHVYAYDKNIENAEIVAGPDVSKYWVDVTLMFAYDKKPSHDLIEVLKTPGIIAKIKQSKIKLVDDKKSIRYGVNYNQYSFKGIKHREEPVWLLELRIPKKLVCNDSVAKNFSDKVDTDNINVVDMEIK